MCFGQPFFDGVFQLVKFLSALNANQTVPVIAPSSSPKPDLVMPQADFSLDL
jgi:hypothetical protein